MSGNPLATMCPCGHTANYHPDNEHQAAYLASTEGRYRAACVGSPFGSGHCQCITSREQVIESSPREEGKQHE